METRLAPGEHLLLYSLFDNLTAHTGGRSMSEPPQPFASRQPHPNRLQGQLHLI